MLAQDGVVHRNAGLQEVGIQKPAAVPLVGAVGVRHDQRVQVATARMQDMGAAQGVFLLHLRHNLQEIGQRGRSVLLDLCHCGVMWTYDPCSACL